MKDDQHNHHSGLFDKIELSAVVTIIGIILLFSTAVTVTLIAPRYTEYTWTQPSSYYQVQMYEIADPHLYVSSVATGAPQLQFVNHLKQDFSLLAFIESYETRIIAPPELEHFITKYGDSTTKLTSNLMLLRKPSPNYSSGSFNAWDAAEAKRKELQTQWEKEKQQTSKIDYTILELYRPSGTEAFTVAEGDGVMENFIDKNFQILDDSVKQPFHANPGVIFFRNPQEYRVSPFKLDDTIGWRYDPQGEPVKDVQQLTSESLGFRSRKELIRLGEHIFAIEGCWYCHTDQTRTLVQDVVLNGSESFPTPPSSPNEYIYQKVTFPGTRRIGPDLSRVGIKRPGRDWHRAHFWSPKTASAGTIMPAFRHFFDNDPRGTAKSNVGIPNYKFEAMYQYLMTKGTRITPPTQAWWLGKDPVQTLEIIEGRKRH